MIDLLSVFTIGMIVTGLVWCTWHLWGALETFWKTTDWELDDINPKLPDYITRDKE
jgi:hypothetical protein